MQNENPCLPRRGSLQSDFWLLLSLRLCGAGTLARDCLRRLCPCWRLHSQLLPYLFGRHPGHANHFTPAGLAGGNGNGRSRHPQKFREEFDAGLIGPSFDWRCGQRDFQRIAEFACDGVLLGAGMNANRERNARLVLTDWDHSCGLSRKPPRRRSLRLRPPYTVPTPIT